jgi:hypothetical protein
MSKKDKKRIAELERQQSILAAKVRIMQYYIGQLYAAKEQPAAFQSGAISSEPKQHETAKDSPTRDGAIYEKTKCVAYEQGEQVLNKSTFDWLKQTRPKQDKSEQEKPRKFPSTPEMKKIEQELEQELLAQLNKELAKFASLEAFNADRKNFFLPPVGKLEFDKAKACFDYALAGAKLLRPEWYDQINQIKIPKAEQLESAKNNEPTDKEIQDKIDWGNAKMRNYCFGNSALNNTKQPDPTLDKTEQEKPAQTEPITPEKEQELMAQLNAELAKFASLEAFNAERRSRFLPPVDKLEFDKAKSCFDYALAAAKVLRPQWYDQINQIKIPKAEQPEAEPKQGKKYMCSGEAQIRNAMANVRNIEPFKSDDDSKYMSDFQVALRYAMSGISKSEQPEAEPKQGSGGADSPKKGSFIKGVFKGKSVNFDADELDAKLRELEALPLKSEYEAAEQTKAAIEQMQQDSPKKEPTFQSQLDEYHAELSDKVISEMNKTMEFWAGVLGLQASKQDETKQTEINHYDPAKATLNKMVLSHVGEMKLWLSLREHSTTEIAQAIQILVDDLGLHLADFRRKVLDLGRVEPCKVEPKETVQCEEKQQETEQNSDGGIWVIHNKLDKTWAAKCSEGGFFWANEKHEEGVLQYADQKEAIEHYNALCSRGLISRMKQQHTAVIREEKQPETDQPTPEKDSENQPEKQQFYLIQTNPNKDQRLNAFYVEMINEKNIVQHTPDPNAAMNFIDADAAQTEIDTIIANSAGRYDAADFKIVEKP